MLSQWIAGQNKWFFFFFGSWENLIMKVFFLIPEVCIIWKWNKILEPISGNLVHLTSAQEYAIILLLQLAD